MIARHRQQLRDAEARVDAVRLILSDTPLLDRMDEVGDEALRAAVASVREALSTGLPLGGYTAYDYAAPYGGLAYALRHALTVASWAGDAAWCACDVDTNGFMVREFADYRLRASEQSRYAVRLLRHVWRAAGFSAVAWDATWKDATKRVGGA